MTTLSPSRYIQIVRYIIQRLVQDHPAIAAWKGRGRARQPHHHQQHTSSQPHALHQLAFAGASLESSHHHNNEPIAGPSRSGEGEGGSSPRSTRPLQPDPNLPPEPTEIYRLMNDERLLVPGSIKPPRETVVLCHGLYGFSTATPIPLFPSLRLHYWASVLEVLRDRMGVNVVVVGVKGTGSIKERAEQMHAYLSETLPKGTGVNFVAHSMGGLDVRHLISTIKPTSYTPLSLTTIGTPHRGSPFMDWCAANIGVGSASSAASAVAIAQAATTSASVSEATKSLPFSLKSPLLARTEQAVQEATSTSGFTSFTSAMTRYLLNIFDSPAYHNLTTSFLRDHFNPNTPDHPKVKYTSVAGRVSKLSVLHPLWFPKLVLDAAAEKGYLEDGAKIKYEGNDGLVSVSSAKWGEFLGAVDDTHHWDLRGEGGLWPNGMGSGNGKESDKDKDKNKDMDKSGNSGKSTQEQVEELIMPGGWDWEDGLADLFGPNDKSSSSSSSSSSISSSSSTPSANSTSSKPSSSSKSDSSSNWDIAQAGQVLDWVTDLLPGGKSTEAGKRQLAEARGEKGPSSEMRERNREKDIEREKKRVEKFDLERFYGGLMLKLREDGL